MKRLKGPELKMPDVKVPPFLEDLYWDLRDRRLLPLLGVVLIAIIAVPFMLASDAKVEPPASPGPSASAQLQRAGATLAVVEATPGLRDYHRRLSGKPTDPFRQHHTASDLKGAQLPALGGGSSGSSDGTVTITGGDLGGGDTGVSGGGGSTPPPSSPAPEESSPPESSPPSSSPPDNGGDAGGGHPGEVTFFTFAMNARITRSGGNDAESRKASKEWDPVVRHRVLPQTSLPGEKAPVVTYMGVSRKGKALLLVSTNVKSIFGETKCVTQEDTCQLIEAEPGFPVVFVYGYNEVHYTINVLKIELVVLDKRDVLPDRNSQQ